FDISVGDPTRISDITSAHIVYLVHTSTNAPEFATESSVSRRYKDFRWLYHALEDNNPGVIVPPPPEKQFVGRFDDDFIETRRIALEKMLQKIAEHPRLQLDPSFKLFLQSETFAVDAKHIVRENDVPTSSGGFMNSLGFGFAPKFVESDEWFTDTKVYAEDLAAQLGVMSKSVDAIVAQRKDLAQATSSLSESLHELAGVEISRSLSELIANLAMAEDRIKAVYERQSMQDMMTIGATIEEYICYIGSFRHTLDQRQKLFLNWQQLDAELNRKRSALDKIRRQGRTQQDKLAQQQTEVTKAEAKAAQAKVAFEEIGGVIKKEFKRLDSARKSDFHQSIETFLESAVEAQKEAIEIWETF
ncbi:hypothetical protein CANCADRAFT_11595, partial [Tortispora caseinolytica NRRL Y-17796]